MPASIGPPETNTVGMFSRIAAISMPGVILSQLEMQISASAQCALTMYSTESAISSRDGSEYSMPPCPIAMPSSTAIVLNSRGIAPAARTASATTRPTSGQVHVAGHELGEAVGDRDDRLAEVLAGYPGRAQQRARSRHVPAVRDRA